MSLLRSTGANVVAISVDNATTNRKFYIDYLCGGKLSTYIFDSVTGQPIYLIFDPVEWVSSFLMAHQHITGYFSTLQ